MEIIVSALESGMLGEDGRSEVVVVGELRMAEDGMENRAGIQQQQTSKRRHKQIWDALV